MSEYQNKILMKSFQTNPYLKKEEKHRLVQSLNISELRIENWFKNMRHRKRAKGLLSEGNINVQ